MIESPLLGSIGPVTFAGLMVAAYFAALVGGMSAFGTGLIMALFLTPLFGAKAVIPILSVFMTFTNASRLWFFREQVDWRTVALVAGPGVPASMLGAAVYVKIESGIIQVLIGLLLIGSIPLRRWLVGKRFVPGPITLMCAGAVLGFATSLLIGTGMLLLPLLLGAGLAGGALIGTDAAVAMITNISKAVMFGQLHALDWPMITVAVAMGLMTVPGTGSARWIMDRTDVRVHTLLVEGLLVLGGLSMIWGALSG